MKIQSWEVLESTTPYPHLRVDSCLLPSGKVISKLIHEYSEWATVLAVTEARDVVLVWQYRHGVKQTILELPGGVIDPGENPLDAANASTSSRLRSGRMALTNPSVSISSCLHYKRFPPGISRGALK